MTTQPHPHRAGLGDEAGMTLVEVMAAMLILLIGVVGLVPLLDTSNRVTNANLARDGGSSLVREQLERVREITYSDLADAGDVAAQVAPLLDGAAAPAGSTFTTTRHGVQYTTTISTCVLDDPSDGIGAAAGTPCNPLTSANGGGGAPVSTSGSSSLNLNVLGIQVTGGGAVVEAVCSLFGTRGSILDTFLGSGTGLSGLVSSGADTTFCSGKGNVAFDRQAADATRVTSATTWSAPSAGRVTQRVVVSGPRVRS